MTKITLEIQNDYMSSFLTLLDTLPKDKIVIQKDKIKDELTSLMNDIDNGKEVLKPFDERFSQDMDKFLAKL